MGRPEDALVGARLRATRLAAGFSQAQIAAALDIPRSAVSMIESGERSLASIELGRLAQIFGWSVQDLLFGPELDPLPAGDDQVGTEVLQYFRRHGALAETDETWLGHAADQWRRYAVVEELVFGAQRFELPSYPVPQGRAYEQGERLAEQERRRIGLGDAPVRSMIDLLEGEGIKILLLHFGSESQVSGCYFFSRQLGPCVVINHDDPPSRRRFTEAHEYCHFLVDRDAIEGEICSPARHREDFEQRANAFAAAFLMPARGIAAALDENNVDRGRLGPEDIVHLMYRFGVSYQAILWRLVNLQWLSRADREKLAQVAPTQLAEDLGYRHEPGEVEAQPDRHRRLAVDAWRTGTIEIGELADLLGMAPADVERVFGQSDLKPRASTRRPPEEPTWL